MYISHKFFNIFFVLFLMFVLFFSANTIHAITLLEDDFTGTTINQTKWTMVGGSEGVDYIQNGNVNVRNSSTSGFGPGNLRVLKSSSNFSKANDLTISANITNTTGAAFLGYGDFSGGSGNYYFVRMNTSGSYWAYIYKAGSYYTNNTSCGSLSAGAKITIKIVSNYFEVYKNDVLACSLSGAVDGSAPVMTSHPVFLQGSTTGSTFDNVLVTNSEVGPPPSTVPDAISNLAASQWGNTTTNLTWTAPSNGGDAITDYTVEYRVSGDVPWISFNDGVSASTGATVTGLTNGVTYEFRVFAVNGVGTSSASNTASMTVLAPIVPSTPNAPTAATVFNINGSKATVTFTPPSANGSAITSYTVTSSPGGLTQNVASSPATFTNLTNGVSYTFTVTATNGVGTSNSSSASNAITTEAFPVGKATWTEQTNSGLRNWSDVASSSDGTKLVAIVYGGYIYTSTDSGSTWTERTNPGSRAWTSVTSSADGVKLAATTEGGYIYTSTDSGATWTQRSSSGSRMWTDMTSSSDGVYLVAITNANTAYYSADSGVNWSLSTTSNKNWTAVGSSSNGATVYLGPTEGLASYIDRSSDYGNYFNNNINLDTSRNWNVITTSDSGSIVFAGANNDYIYKSIDSGANWSALTQSGQRAWTSIASSSDGNIIIASASSGVVLISVDGGTNWITETSTANWNSVDISSDGLKVVATIGAGNYIYTGIVDITTPTITNVSSDKANGTYTTGEVIDIDVAFSEAVTSTGNVTVTLETGTTDRTCTFAVTNSTTGTCNYTVVAGDETSDLTVKTISGTISDQHLNTMTDFVPVTNLAANKAITIDTTAPTIIQFGATPSSTTAIVTWETNENSSSIVDYGVTNSYETSTAESDTSPRVTSHTVNLSSLVPCTTYFFQVRSRDAALNSVVNQSFFTTLGCIGDASIVSSTLGFILDSTGGTKELVTGVDKSINLSIPAGTVSDDASFQIKQLDQVPALLVTGTPSGAIASSSHVYDLKALTDANTAITSFNDQITITLNYLDEDVVGIVESSLLIYRWDGVTWNPLSGCVVDTVLNIVTCNTTNFSVFSLFGTPIPSPSSSFANGAVSVAFLQELSDRLRKESSNNNITPVKKEEKKCGILPDNPKILKLNSKHSSVKTLQQILNCKGYTVSVSGVGSPGKETTLFGLKTRAQILKFQKDNNLKTDGIVGPQFRKLINK